MGGLGVTAGIPIPAQIIFFMHLDPNLPEDSGFIIAGLLIAFAVIVLIVYKIASYFS